MVVESCFGLSTICVSVCLSDDAAEHAMVADSDALVQTLPALDTTAVADADGMLASSDDIKPTISHTRCSVCDTPLVGARFSTLDLSHSLSRVLCLVSRRLWEYPQPDQRTPAHPLVVSSRSLDHPNVGHCHARLTVAVAFSLRSMLRRVCCVVCIGVI